MRKRGLGFHGNGRIGTVMGGQMGTPGTLGHRVATTRPAGFNAMGPAPRFPGRGQAFSLPQANYAPRMGSVPKLRDPRR